MPQLWTFNVYGNVEDTFIVPGNPRIQHRGHSLFHWILTQNQALAVAGSLRDRGYRVTYWEMSGESAEQKEERKKLLTQQDRVWPCIRCPGCFWFDPREDDPCLYTGKWNDMREDLLEKWPFAREDLARCPVLED